ncbi:MAG: PaaI family thioesterase [Desulfovibrionaceae bacterium]|nr:PaaI family thioesterase [Desulfovibrionaceae bacterium]
MNLEEVRRHFDAHDTFARHLGIDIVEIGPEKAVVSMPFDERHRNGLGHAHGGAIFALADLAFAVAANAAGPGCVNAQTSISYIAPGKVGPLRGEARALHIGRKLVTYEVSISDAAGTLVAKAQITGYVKGLPPAL